jgi:Kef-type K+ transport system membrane component KefB
MHGLSEHHILLFLIQVLILLGLARGLGELLRRVGQPSLIGDAGGRISFALFMAGKQPAMRPVPLPDLPG